MNNNNPLISVIVPIYNIERYVGICIESIINQEYKNLEIILVDDGSTDRSGDICDLYAKKDSRISVIHKPNGGLVSARKAGIKVANGKYSTYVDGDDWIEKDYYSWLIKEIGDTDLVISGHSRTLFNKTTYITSNIPHGLYDGSELVELKKNMISNEEFFHIGISTYVWNKLFKTELLKKYQLLVSDNISIGEDAAVTYPLIMESSKLVITDNCGYRYRQREDSMLKKSRPFSEDLIGIRELHKYLSSFASKYDESFKLQKQIDDFVLGIAIIRSGGLKIGNVCPFEKDFKNKNVAIYSAGTFGQQLANRVNDLKYCNIVCWVDDDYWEYRRCCLDVDPIDTLKDKSFDYVLIASINSKVVKNIRKILSTLGIDGGKVVSICSNEEDRKKLLGSYLYD